MLRQRADLGAVRNPPLNWAVPARIHHAVACPDETELTAFLGGTLAAARRSEIEQHFDACADCRQLAYVLATDGKGARATTGGGGDAPGAGTRVGRFEIVAPIAEGAMGIICRAHDTTLRRDVAIKLLRGVSADGHARMLREAQGLARLDHPNVVGVYETGMFGDEVFIAMELIDGVSLDRWLAVQPRSWRQIAAVLSDAGRGLAAAHAAGLVHRDFKPANIMIGSDRRVKVVDFGLARAVAEALPRPSEAMDVATRLTATGMLVGTPAYCAPEQLAGYEVDTASDVFSFCVTFCEAVFGTRPYVGATADELLARMGDPRGPNLPRTPHVPVRLRAALRRGLAFDPAQRPAIGELLAALDPRPRRRAVIAAVALAGALASAVPIAIAARSSGAEPCTTARSELAPVWNAQRRARIRDALLATQLPFAAATWQQVERALDGYAESWVTTHTDACRATAVHHTQSTELLDRRMACLANRRADLDATVALLADIDRNSAREALRITASIPSLAACSDATGLLALSPPPAETPDLALLRQEIARASAMRAAGSFEASVAVASEAVERAERIGYKPLLAEALFTRGLSQNKLEQRAPSRDSYERAIWAAAASGYTALEASALAELALLLRDESPDGRVAIGHASHAVALLDRTSHDPLLEAKVHYALARAIASSDQAQAEREYTVGRQALAEAEKVDPNAARLLRIDYEIIRARLDSRPDEAVARLKALLAEAERWWGPDHINNAVILWELADNANLADHNDEAQGYARRVAQLLAPYPGHDVLLRRLQADLEEDPEKRLPLYESLARDAETFFGKTSPQVAITLHEIGDTLLELGRAQEALSYIDRSIAMFESSYGTRYQFLVQAHSTRAQVLQQLGKLEQAIAAAERANDLARRNHLSPVFSVYADLMLGEMYFRTGRYEATLTAIAAVREHLDLLPPLNEAEMLELDFVEAACNYKLGREPITRTRTIHERYQHAPGHDGPSVADQREWLAAEAKRR